MGRIGFADSGVGIDDIEGGIRIHFMSQPIGSTHRQHVFLVQTEIILQTEVQGVI